MALTKFPVYDRDTRLKDGNKRRGKLLGHAATYVEAEKVAKGDVQWRRTTFLGGSLEKHEWVKVP
jgi:hypothetical protein